MFWCVCRELGLVWTGKPWLESNVYSLFYLVNKVCGRLKPKTCIKTVCWSYRVGLRSQRWNQLYLCGYFEFFLFTCSSFKLHSTHNIFCFVNNNTGLPWALYHKKKTFLIFIAKTHWNQLYSIKSIFWFLCRKIVSLPALLHLEKVFFQFAASHPGF